MREWQNRIVFDEKDNTPLIVLENPVISMKITSITPIDIEEKGITDYLHEAVELTKEWLKLLFDPE